MTQRGNRQAAANRFVQFMHFQSLAAEGGANRSQHGGQSVMRIFSGG